MAQAEPPSASSSTSTTRLKRGTGLLVMAQDPQRVLQAICQPAQPTAPACMLLMGWQNPPASLITLQPVLHPLDPGCREAVCVAQLENKAAPVIWNWERHAGPSLLALLAPGTNKAPKHQHWGTGEPLTLIPLRLHSISLSQPDFSQHSGIFWTASYYSSAH